MKYRVLTPISHNKVEYAVGDEINISSSEAAQLLEVNAIGSYEKEVKPVDPLSERANDE